MASIIPIGNKWRAQVRRKGEPTLTKTFEKKSEAEQWATFHENGINAGKKTHVHGERGHTLKEAIELYLRSKDHSKPTMHQLMVIQKDEIGQCKIEDLTEQMFVNFVDQREVEPVTGKAYYTAFTMSLRHAHLAKNWFVPTFPMLAKRLKHLGLIGSSKCRQRLPTPEEVTKLLEYDWNLAMPMADMIAFARASAMRQAEICRICWSTFDEVKKTILITDRKHPTKKKGNDQVVPLLDEAIAIIKRQPRIEGEDRIFPYTPKLVSHYFGRGRTDLGIVNLHFHDFRHEATTELFKMGYTVEQVQLFTGHLDLKMLMRYTHLKATDIPRLKPSESTPAAKSEPNIDPAEWAEFQQYKAFKAMMAAQQAA